MTPLVRQTLSKRTPQYSTHNNNADNIERYLQEDRHQKWGFVIYRCTYESDSDWGKFMDRLRYQIRFSLNVYNGLDMLDSLELTIFDDPSLFNGASTSAAREYFKQWTATAPQREQAGAGPALSQRYRYCIHVDTKALESVIEGDDPDGTISEGFVNLIWKDWTPANPDDLGEEVEEPVEDCTLHDVGWMMVEYQSVMVDMYYYLRGLNDWYRGYRRPPEVAHA